MTSVLFDEFLSRKSYLPDEFVLFMNTLSTIIRERDNVKIYMMANTVSKESPYFKEMGLKHIDTMKQGTVSVYNYGDSELKVAIEYCENYKKIRKKSDKYFAFDNEKLKMITGGAWEVAVYNPVPCKYKPTDIKFTYFIKWNDKLIQCEIIKKDNMCFTYCHLKTTELKDSNKDLVFSPDGDSRVNWIRNILKPTLSIQSKIIEFFHEDKVYYQDADVGETVRAYLQYCSQFTIIKS